LRRGATLAEVLVAGALLAVVLGVVTLLLLPGWRAWMRGSAKSEVQQSALVVLTRVVGEFENANGASVSVQRNDAVDSDGKPVRRDAIIFLSDEDDHGRVQLGPDGDPIWQKRVVIYHDGDTEQVRSIAIPLPSPTVDPDPLLVSTFSPSPRDRIVARNVHSLAFDWDMAPALHVEVEAHTEKYASRFQSTVLPVLSTFVPEPSPSPSP
jgi:hypothetical protein